MFRLTKLLLASACNLAISRKSVVDAGWKGWIFCNKVGFKPRYKYWRRNNSRFFLRENGEKREDGTNGREEGVRKKRGPTFPLLLHSSHSPSSPRSPAKKSLPAMLRCQIKRLKKTDPKEPYSFCTSPFYLTTCMQKAGKIKITNYKLNKAEFEVNFILPKLNLEKPIFA
jgi:hypothetical protein